MEIIEEEYHIMNKELRVEKPTNQNDQQFSISLLLLKDIKWKN